MSRQSRMSECKDSARAKENDAELNWLSLETRLKAVSLRGTTLFARLVAWQVLADNHISFGASCLGLVPRKALSSVVEA
ncbi:uncharacterized protein G2W53_014019 [Senna tora]|uniref:Uncharacterized protein n=1 Tax=Senna tora TaxID=362788 RepID=A0A834U2Y5_9FABA|nr:uncharacterized protein G2W53_014019 [Senna tora]